MGKFLYHLRKPFFDWSLKTPEICGSTDTLENFDYLELYIFRYKNLNVTLCLFLLANSLSEIIFFKCLRIEDLMNIGLTSRVSTEKNRDHF